MRTRKLGLPAIAGLATLAMAVASIAIVAVKRPDTPRLRSARPFVLHKADRGEYKPTLNAEAAIGPNEARLPDNTPAAAEAAIRAYPADDVPLQVTINS